MEFVYKVVFEGDVLQGFGQLDVQKKLAKYLAIDVSTAARLFMSKQIEIKRGITLSHAKKCVQAMAKMGALTYLVPAEECETDEIVDDSVEEFTASGSFSAVSFSEYFENREAIYDVEEVEGEHEIIDPDDVTQPAGCPSNTDVNKVQSAQSVVRQHLESISDDEGLLDAYEPEEREDITLPGGYPVYTDLNKIREMQELTRRMLAQKKMYE